MRPQRIELSGFGAFREATDVDLSDVELVALVGPTGAGKSTLIDAITFALYGSVSRYDDNRAVAPVISALAEEARVRLDFTVGDDAYTVVRVVKRTKSGGATTREARLEAADGTVLAGSARELPAQVERLVGLTFEQFTTTVVLPQGDFAEFLHETPAERQKLLRRLFDLELYELMGRDARAQAKDARTRAAWLREQIEREGEVVEADIERLAAEVERLAGCRRDAVDLVERLGVLDGERDGLDAEIGSLEGQRGLLEGVVVPDDVGEVERRAVDAAAALAEARRARQDARSQVAEADEAVSRGPDEADCARMLSLHEERAAAGDRLADARRRHDEAQAVEAEARAAADRARADVTDARAAARVAREACTSAERDAEEGPDAARCRRLLDAVEERAAVVADRDLLAAEVHEAEDASRAAEQALAEASERVDDATARVEQARLAAGAVGLMAAVAVGEPCPVCRQVVHELPDHDADAEAEAAELAAADARRARDEAESERRRWATRLAAAQGRRAEVDSRVRRLDDELVGAPEPAELSDALARAEQLREVVQEARRAAERAEAHADDVAQGAEHREALAREAAAGREVAATAEAVTAAEARQRELDEALADAPEVEVLERRRAEAVALAQALVGARRAAAEADEVEERASAQAAASDRAVEAARRSLVAVRERVAGLSPPPADGGSLLDDWAALATWADDTLALVGERLGRARARLGELAVARRDETRALDALAEGIDEAVAGGGSVVERLASAQAGADAALRAARERRDAQAERRREAATLEEDAAVARDLGQLLQATGFEAWLLEEAVAELVERATERLLDLSSGAYSLVADGHSLAVCDHRNADEVRDAKTLSGGETFLASLALALALADTVADLATAGAPRLESIFLDEGFGTLDPETLDTVASAIVELGASGRMVGIVTHIADLAEQVPVRLEVARGASGSTVTRVEG